MTETTTLQPLDVSPWATEPEPKALTDFKKRVAAVAKSHSTRFHCGEYKSVLRELGMEDATKTIRIRMATAGGFNFTVSLEPHKLAGLGVEEQAEVLLKALGEVYVSSENGDAEGTIEIDPRSITSWEILTRPPSDPPGPNEGVWLYASAEGRVQHWYPYYWEGETLRRVDGQDMRGWYYAICHFNNWQIPRENSPKGENRRCAKCEARLRTRSS